MVIAKSTARAIEAHEQKQLVRRLETVCETLRANFDRLSGQRGPDRRNAFQAWQGSCELLRKVRGF